MATQKLIDHEGHRVKVRPSTTPGYSYDAWLPAIRWSADEWILTHRGACHLSGGGSVSRWVPLHQLNHAQLYEAAHEMFRAAVPPAT